MRWDGVKRWATTGLSEQPEYVLKSDDVVLAMDRPWIEAGLKYARILEADLPCLLVQRVACLRALETQEQRFLYYVIGSRAFTDHVLGIQTGTAVPHISGDQIRRFEYILPPLPEQRTIASVLGALDDKIELNRRMNVTLEDMAAAIFKAWFVDFEPVHAKANGATSFPGMPQEVFDSLPSGFVDSELGEIPEGWEVKSLDEIADYLNGLALQKYPPDDGPSLPRLKIAQLRKGNVEGADMSNSKVPEKYVVQDGDVIFSWSGSLLVKIWTGGNAALNQHLFKVTSEHYPKWFYHLWTAHHLDDFQRTAANKATTMGHIKRHHLSDARVVVPLDSSSDSFASMTTIIDPLFDQCIANDLEARSLANARDTLLPKLLSGEVRIPIVESAPTHDDQGNRCQAPSRDALLEIARLAEPLEHEPVAELASSDPSDGGPISMPIMIYGETIEKLVKLAYEHDLVVSFDWTEWQSQAEELINDPVKLAGADLVMVQRLMTLHVRKERFCEGHLSEMHASGHLVALLRRIGEIAEGMKR